MTNSLEKDRMDIIQVDGECYVVAFEDNTIPGSIDARVIPYHEKLDYSFGNTNVGSVVTIDENAAQNPDETIEYIEDEFEPNPSNEALEELINF